MTVVGHHERNCAGGVADPADDRAEHIGQLGIDDQQSLGVGLGGSDVQQRDELAGAGQPILHEAVMRQLGQLFDPNACERRTSITAQAQNARCSSNVRSRRFPVSGSSAETLAVGFLVTDLRLR